MKRVCLFLALLLTVMPLACAAESRQPPYMTEEALVQRALQDYPGWKLWRSATFVSGTWNGENAQHAEIDLYRIHDEKLEMRELYVLMNPLREGGDVAWEEMDYAPVCIAAGMEASMDQMPPEELFDYGTGAHFTQEALRLLAPEFLAEDEQMYCLLSFPETLLALTENTAGRYRMKIAQWDGSAFTQAISTPEQNTGLDVNEIHSWDGFIEIYYGEMEGCVARCGDGQWRLTALDGGDVITLSPEWIMDATWGGTGQNNDGFYYGRPQFATELTAIDFEALPRSLEEAVRLLDRSRVACTARDGAGLYEAPGGKQIAECYARVSGVITAREGEWVRLRIGSAQDGLSGWFRREDLAYGADTDRVECTFPSYTVFYDGEGETHTVVTSGGREIVLDTFEQSPWLIGKTAEGEWLALLNGDEEGTVCTAAEDAFEGVGPVNHESGW